MSDSNQKRHPLVITTSNTNLLHVRFGRLPFFSNCSSSVVHQSKSIPERQLLVCPLSFPRISMRAESLFSMLANAKMMDHHDRIVRKHQCKQLYAQAHAWPSSSLHSSTALSERPGPASRRRRAAPYLAMTSTYRPPFFLPRAPPLRGAAAPRRSSMLLALLMLVAGRLGGALAAPPGGPVLAVEAVRSIGGAAGPGEPPIGGVPPPSDGAGVDAVLGGGMAPVGPAGGGVPDPALDMARGGGGVADLGAWSSAPAALFTQRFCSGS